MAIQGIADKKYRYIYTMVDKRPQFLIMNKCNFCPFLINDYENGSAKCGKFVNVKSVWTDKNYIAKVYGYIQKRTGTMDMNILTQIDIPSWCNLPDHLTRISPNDAISYIKDGKLIVECGQNYSNAVQIIDANEIEYGDDGESLVLKPLKPTYINYGKDGKTIFSTSSDTSTSYKSIDTGVCSMCGEDKDEVDRNSHIGMCNECWSKYKFSHPKRRISFINNFRLKRKESWVGEEFKKVIVNKL